MIMVFMSLMSLSMDHPMMLMLTLLIQTTMITLSMGMMYPDFWFSYMMFLIMIGSILILFTYMTSVASNEKFYINNKLLFTNMMMSVIIMMMIKIFNNKIFKSTEVLNLEKSMSFKKMFYNPLNNSFIIAVIYLLLTLLVVIKMTEMKSKPFNKN
uniref:NADH-ubiquinone oxidoreductase chain 6 n=1 Tax=Platypodinae sp. BMNH 1274714 TaxID=2558030 RepID=A0A126TG73_9CUCU|nr:NADH dehydrogenase subunit 6 [Platypodinae sp. BMNH 1274714]